MIYDILPTSAFTYSTSPFIKDVQLARSRFETHKESLKFFPKRKKCTPSPQWFIDSSQSFEKRSFISPSVYLSLFKRLLDSPSVDSTTANSKVKPVLVSCNWLFAHNHTIMFSSTSSEVGDDSFKRSDNTDAPP